MALKYLPGDSIQVKVNKAIKYFSEDKEIDTSLVSDGYHTFKELYEHRVELFITLCRKFSKFEYLLNESIIWRSKVHSDGTSYEGWFLLGIFKEKGKQITYHLPMSKWEETEFAETLDKAPEFDGHTSEDVLKRLKEL